MTSPYGSGLPARGAGPRNGGRRGFHRHAMLCSVWGADRTQREGISGDPVSPADDRPMGMPGIVGHELGAARRRLTGALVARHATPRFSQPVFASPALCQPIQNPDIRQRHANPVTHATTW